MAEDGQELKGRHGEHTSPMPTSYRPELDTTPKCDKEHLSQYRQIIGILQWAIDSGRIDILMEVAMLSQYQASPREGHLEAIYWLVNYLLQFPMQRLVLNHMRPEIDKSVFQVAEWSEFYGNIVEEDPPYSIWKPGCNVMLC